MGHRHLPTKMNLQIHSSCWEIFIAVITLQLFMWQVHVCRAQSRYFYVGVMIIIDNEPIIEFNNLFSYGVKVIMVWSTKLVVEVYINRLTGT